MFVRISIAVISVILIISGALSAGVLEKESFIFPKDDIEKVVIHADLGAGRFSIKPADMEEIFKADVEYSARRLRVFADYEKEGGTGYIDFGSDLSWKKEFDTKDNMWDIILSNRYPAEMEIDISACEADFDLGGIPITYLDFDLGAADGKLDFSKPNPDIADKVNFDAGAGKFEISNLGNLNFRRLYLDGGAGKFEIDFSGKYTMRSRAKISLGLASTVIYIPRGVPFSIEADDSFLSSMDFDELEQFEVDKGFYESDDYESSDIGLELEVNVGVGSVEFRWAD
ncbi:MAG: hypothetical protein CVT49_04550 [candidate division Zixibacteria bacterium HGW-Zixibacteria-1]|nr:MAG: hypothetical protein CVT49_04550 [candidate division Zixibacteria bacterium HGW-Zixibacteria-1]